MAETAATRTPDPPHALDRLVHRRRRAPYSLHTVTCRYMPLHAPQEETRSLLEENRRLRSEVARLREMVAARG